MAFIVNPQAVKLLIEAGLDLNSTTTENQSVLHYASANSTSPYEVFSLLRDCDCNYKDIHGTDPVMRYVTMRMNCARDPRVLSIWYKNGYNLKQLGTK